MKSSNLYVLFISGLCIANVLAEPVPVYTSNLQVSDPQNAVIVGDFDISTNIRTQIAADPFLLQVNPNVFCNNGVVTFQGQVSDLNQAIKLIQIAETIPGVKDVITTNLVDQSGNQLPPSVVAVAKTQALLMRSKLFGDIKDSASLPVQVSAVTEVLLTGTVDTQEQADQAVAIAKSAGNVVVKSEIKVNSTK